MEKASCSSRYSLPIVNLDPYTFADALAEDIAHENERRSAEEVLLSTIDNTADDKLTRFALRLALSGHVGMPRENEFDFLTEAEAVFAPPQPKKANKPTRIKANNSTIKKPPRRRSQRKPKRESVYRLPLTPQRKRDVSSQSSFCTPGTRAAGPVPRSLRNSGVRCEARPNAPSRDVQARTF